MELTEKWLVGWLPSYLTTVGKELSTVSKQPSLSVVVVVMGIFDRCCCGVAEAAAVVAMLANQIAAPSTKRNERRRPAPKSMAVSE
jgi:hypothetical protein